MTTVMPLGEYAAHDATSLARLVADAQVTPSELLDTAIAAVEAVNPQLNAVVLRFDDAARQAIAAGLPEGPFRGVPFLLKDLTAHAKGQITSSGWVARADAVVDHDSE